MMTGIKMRQEKYGTSQGCQKNSLKRQVQLVEGVAPVM